MQKILIVEDDEKLKEELGIFLSKNGYEIELINTFNNTIQSIIDANADLVLLDINLPNFDGEYICKEVRKVSNVPIIMITSRENEIDEIISLNYGADQYVTKPFNIQILLAKISSLLRRTNELGISQDKIDCKQFILNLSQSKIEKENISIELTKNELKIIHFLVLNRGKIISRESLMSYLWDTESFVDENTLSVNIKRLRDKLEELELKDIIETRRGQGYILK